MNVSKFEGLVRKTSNVSRIVDAALFFVFAYYAWSSDSTEWRVLFVALAVFCLLTAIFGPVEIIFGYLRKFFLKSGVVKRDVPAQDDTSQSRQQRRAAARKEKR